MGHGHVTPNRDGSKARCGGPAICSECALELAAAPTQKRSLLLTPYNLALAREKARSQYPSEEPDDVIERLARMLGFDGFDIYEDVSG